MTGQINIDSTTGLVTASGTVGSVTLTTSGSSGGSSGTVKIVEDTANDYHYASAPSFSGAASTAYVYTARLKSSNRVGQLQVMTSDGASGRNVRFDLQGAGFLSKDSWGSCTDSNITCTSDGAGGWVCSVTVNFSSAATLRASVFVAATSGAISYTGDGASFVQIVEQPTVKVGSGSNLIPADPSTWTPTHATLA